MFGTTSRHWMIFPLLGCLIFFQGASCVRVSGIVGGRAYLAITLTTLEMRILNDEEAWSLLQKKMHKLRTRAATTDGLTSVEQNVLKKYSDKAKMLANNIKVRRRISSLLSMLMEGSAFFDRRVSIPGTSFGGVNAWGQGASLAAHVGQAISAGKQDLGRYIRIRKILTIILAVMHFLPLWLMPELAGKTKYGAILQAVCALRFFLSMGKSRWSAPALATYLAHAAAAISALQKTGVLLTKADVLSIKLKEKKKSKLPEKDKNALESGDCSICLSSFSEKQCGMLISEEKEKPCGHFFHIDCLNQWFDKKISERELYIDSGYTFDVATDKTPLQCPCCRRKATGILRIKDDLVATH